MSPYVRLLTAIAGSMVFSATPAQEQVRFTGNTSADATLIHDAFQYVALYVRESLKCPNIELVESEVLPDGAIKRDPARPEGTGPATFERWTVTFCGKKRPFLIVFWPSKEGGTMYRVELSPGTDS